MSTKRVMTIIAIVVLVIGVGIAYYIRTTRAGENTAAKTAYITVTAAPSDSSVSLNGKSGAIGLNAVVPGDYKVTISHQGFASVSKSVTAAKGADAQVAFALTPNDASTANWYQTHPKDAAIAANITDPKYSSAPANPKPAASLATLLPFQTGGDNPFVIVADPDSEDKNNPLYYIEADSLAAQQDAQTWLKNQGYDPAKLNLKYISTTNPSRP